MSKPASRQDPLTNSESYVYDLAGKLIRFTDRKGQCRDSRTTLSNRPDTRFGPSGG